jgi:nucleotide-binding universal stress UspA family protein
MLALRTILHPTDFSDRAQAAFELARSLAKDYDARLILLHVAMPPVVVYPAGIVNQPATPIEAELNERLDQLRARAPGVNVSCRLEEGDPVTEILAVAKEARCDLIVLGTHGWTGLSRLLMGSVAEQVLRKAPCPVITVKTPFPAPPAEEGLIPEEAALI